MKKEESNKVLEDYFSTENLMLAYLRVVRWPDRLVKDKVGIHAFGSILDENIVNLSKKLIAGTYKPQKPFKFYEPKARSKSTRLNSSHVKRSRMPSSA